VLSTTLGVEDWLSMLNYFFVHPYPRATLAALLGAVAYLATPMEATETRLLVGWNTAALCLLGAITAMMLRATPQETAQRSREEEPSGVLTIATMIVVTIAGFVGTAAMLDSTAGMGPLGTYVHLGLSMGTVVTAWLMAQVYFALLYARLYYDEPAAEGAPPARGLEFPGTDTPDYLDFVYYSITIALCYQTSDITVTTRFLRRITILHSIVGFFFVSAVIGLVVNIVSNMI